MTDDVNERVRTAAADSAARERLNAGGLDLRLVPAGDAGFGAWLQAVNRGFLSAERTEDEIEQTRVRAGARRNIGVYDTSGPMPDLPVGTFVSWGSELSVPGGATVPVTAISDVTVAPTHHRRGVARAMMEGELRVAAAAGMTAAVLTASEATLYGRYGFAPAASVAMLRLEARRAGWIGPIPTGRLDFVSREEAGRIAPGLHDRVRRTWPGEITTPEGHWDGITRTRPDAERAGQLRAVRYETAAGETTGLALYTVTENTDDFTKSSVSLSYLLAVDAEAYAALWRFLVTMDLVSEISAGELSTAEPRLWLIADQRAAAITVRDHQYVRILDVAAALGARRYGAPGTLALDVRDPLGIGGGRWILSVDDEGRGEVSPWTGLAAPAGATPVRLGTSELSAAYLGSVSLVSLAAAGRVEADDVESAARMLSWHVPARLSFWY